jgi:hypothetical protein
MAIRYYITPTVAAHGFGRTPKYIIEYIFQFGVPWGGMDYGFQPIYLVAADLSAAQDAAVVANSDVFAFPFNLTTSVGGGNVTSAQTALETALIPAQWVNGAMVWRDVARIVAGMFQYMIRLQVVHAARTGGNTLIVDTSAKLNVQFGTLPVEIQGDILNAAQSLGYSTAGITSTTQLRAILKLLADQWGNETFHLGPFNL